MEVLKCILVNSYRKFVVDHQFYVPFYAIDRVKKQIQTSIYVTYNALSTVCIFKSFQIFSLILLFKNSKVYMAYDSILVPGVKYSD